MLSQVQQTSWVEREKKYYFQTFSRLPVVLVRGQGVRVWDEAGKPYLDLVAGIAVNALGHAHPDLLRAISEQAAKLIHVSNLYYSTPQLELAELLVEHTCGDRVFFVNSGAEANETLIKLAQKYGKKRLNGAHEIITVTNAFHGRTMATVAATGQEKFAKPYGALPPGFRTVPFNDLEAMRAAVGPGTCAILIEVVQGESGVHIASREYVRGLRELCDERGLLFMLDEVQTGIGRTGAFMGYEHYGVEPDAFSLAKGLGGGVPIGAGVAKEEFAVLEPSDHGSTFGGNPLAGAAGVATVRTVLRDKLHLNAAEVGAYFLGKLEELRKKDARIVATRGKGLMLAFDLAEDVAPALVNAALGRGLILNATGPRTIRMVPPLILTKAEVDEALQIIADALSAP
ncbi:MAG TPA: aspartate aminotransferase family protein [Chloroflexota bacterium]|jgi:acetylornithine aminotransferase/acetylornithine/N-succinyldiaminopimelate aminotransferase|nr:aspartate aminotransferase family protein [Chloroflexota bacterium]